MIPANFLKAFAQLFHTLIQIYILVIIVRSVISWLGNIPPNRLIMILRQLTDPVFRFVHRHLPFLIVGGIDISPIVIVIALYFIDSFVTETLMDIAVKMRG
ncbi:MAG: YggT family protein [bacterium]|nr:YggT family protein [bacterium]